MEVNEVTSLEDRGEIHGRNEKFGEEVADSQNASSNSVKSNGKGRREKRFKPSGVATPQQSKSKHLATLKQMEPNKRIPLQNLFGNQIRKKNADLETVERYVEMLDLTEAPNIVVINDENGKFIISDGHNRAAAALRAGRKEIVADVYKGTRKDARIVGLELNQGSLPMTLAERKSMLDELLDNPDLSYKTVELIAMTGLSRPTVEARKRELETGDFLASVSAMKRSKSLEDKFNDAVKAITRLAEKNGSDAVVKALNSLPVLIREEVISGLSS